MTRIQTFNEMRSLDVTCDLTLRDLGSEIFTKYAEKMYDKVCQKRCAAPFSDHLGEVGDGVGVLNSPLTHQGEG